jgi:hypothetical protein
MRLYLSIFVGILFISLIGLFLILEKLSPNLFPILAPLLFYSCLFFASFSLFSLLGYFFRRLFNRKINKFISFTLSFRQGFLLAIFTSLSTYFLHKQIFTWWLEILVLFGLLIVEMFFLVRER